MPFKGKITDNYDILLFVEPGKENSFCGPHDGDLSFVNQSTISDLR